MEGLRLVLAGEINEEEFLQLKNYYLYINEEIINLKFLVWDLVLEVLIPC